jgi:hypothetical protein
MSTRARTMTMATLSVRKGGGRRKQCQRDVRLFGERMSDMSRRTVHALTQSNTYDVLMGAA